MKLWRLVEKSESKIIILKDINYYFVKMSNRELDTKFCEGSSKKPIMISKRNFLFRFFILIIRADYKLDEIRYNIWDRGFLKN